jgi:hypothetical protein
MYIRDDCLLTVTDFRPVDMFSDFRGEVESFYASYYRRFKEVAFKPFMITRYEH